VQWYAAHCDGEWEHGSGIKLTTLDNPGWRLKINIADTELQHVPFASVEYQLTDDISWWRCWRDEAVFHAACGVNNLNAVIDVFIAWANNHRQTA
jgi:hypothetical protein